MSGSWFVLLSFKCTLCSRSRSLRRGKERKGAGSGGFCGQKPRRGARSGRRISLSFPFPPSPHPGTARRNSTAAAGREQCRARDPRPPPSSATHHPGQCPVAAGSRAAAAARLGHGGASAHRPRGRGRRSRLPAGRRAPLLRTDRSARRAPSGAAPRAPSPRPGTDARPSLTRRPRRPAPSNSRRGGRVARA